MDHNGKHNGHGHLPDHDDHNVIQIPTLAERDKARRDAEKEWRKRYRQTHQGEKFINLPPMTKIMVITLLAIHLFMTFVLDPPAQQWVFDHFGFVSSYYTRDFPGWPAFVGPFTYMLFHDGWIHIGMNSVMLIAFGAGVEKWIGGKQMLILFVLCSLGASLCQFIIAPFSNGIMIGASGGMSGLFSAILIMMQQQGRMGTGRYGLLPLIIFWVGISFMFGLLGGPGGSSIAWAAHIGGFLAGFLVLKPVMRIR